MSPLQQHLSIPRAWVISSLKVKASSAMNIRINEVNRKNFKTLFLKKQFRLIILLLILQLQKTCGGPVNLHFSTASCKLLPFEA